jgi:hypothetical protein
VRTENILSHIRAQLFSDRETYRGKALKKGRGDTTGPQTWEHCPERIFCLGRVRKSQLADSRAPARLWKHCH